MHIFFLFIAFTFTIASCKSTNSKTKYNNSTDQNTPSNIIILEKSFKVLNEVRKRKIRIYLPINYSKSNKKYPVLYMHDGQNLFDKSTSFAGEWNIDESLDKLSKSDNLNLIVVGIDNGQEKRINEMSPWENKKYGTAEGTYYMDFIVNQIKPYIDSTYRTYKDRKNTAIMGSSLGGLISHYAIYKYPEIFGKAGNFSPSYWYSNEVFDYTIKNPIPKDTRIYLVVGKKEDGMVSNTEKMYNQIINSKHPQNNIIAYIDPEGEHNESSWGKQFIPAVKWLFGK